MKTLVEYIELFLVGAILFTACVYNDSMVLGIVISKIVWFSIMTGLFFATSILNRSYATLNLNGFDILIGLFFIYIILNSSLHDKLLLSIKNFETACLFALYFLSKKAYSAATFAYTPFIFILLLLTFSQILVGYLQFYNVLSPYNSNFRITGFFFNPAPYAIFLTILLPLSLMVMLFQNNRNLTIIGGALFITGIPIIAQTISRSAWIGLIAGIIFIVGYRFNLLSRIRFLMRGLRILLLSGLLILIICCGIYFYNIKRESANGRLLIWKISSEMVSDALMTGIGADNFAIQYLRYQAKYFESLQLNNSEEGILAGYVLYAFNDLLQITVELGIIGLALFIGILYQTFKTARDQLPLLNREKDNFRNIVILFAVTTLIVILISGLFSYPLTILPVKIMFCTALALLSACFGNSLNSFKIHLKEPIVRHGVPILILILSISIIIYALEIKRAYKEWYKVETLGYEGEDIQSLYRYRSILDQSPRFGIALGKYYLMERNYNSAIKVLENSKSITSDPSVYDMLGYAYYKVGDNVRAELNYQFVVYALPSLLQPKYRLAKLYYANGETAKWRRQAKLMLNFNPKIKSRITDELIREIDSLHQHRK